MSSAICVGCNLVIEEGNVVNFSDTLYHISCFRCAKCSGPIDYQSSVVLLAEDGRPMCINCGLKCKGCGNAIVEEAITTGNF